MDNNLGSINQNNENQKEEEKIQEHSTENDNKDINNELNPSNNSSNIKKDSESTTKKNDNNEKEDNKKNNQIINDNQEKKSGDNSDIKKEDEKEIDKKDEIKENKNDDKKEDENKFKDENDVKIVKEEVNKKTNENPEDEKQNKEKKENNKEEKEENKKEEISENKKEEEKITKNINNEDMNKDKKENKKEKEEYEEKEKEKKEKEEKEKEKKEEKEKDNKEEKKEATDNQKNIIENEHKEESNNKMDDKDNQIQNEKINKEKEEIKEENPENSQIEKKKSEQEEKISKDKNENQNNNENEILNNLKTEQEQIKNEKKEGQNEVENKSKNSSTQKKEDAIELEDLSLKKTENSEEGQNLFEKNEEESELAKRIEEEEIKQKKIEENRKKLEELRKQREIEQRKQEINSFENSLNELLLNIEISWKSEDKNNFATNYEYTYSNNMTDLFNKINDNESIKDEIITLIFKFICDYLHSRRKFLNEIPWVELNYIKKILLKSNFEGFCILNNNQLLINCYHDLLKKYNIENNNENIIEYDENTFVKYMAEFFFKDGFYEMYIDNVITREDEIFLSFDNLIYDNTSSFITDLLNIIFYPLEALNFCHKEFLLKNNYLQKYMNNFLKKIDTILNSSALKEQFKKSFYGEIIDKYKFIMKNIFNKIFDEFKEKNGQIMENFVNFFTKIGEFYLHQQKLETRIYGLTLITQLIETIQNMNANQNDKNAKIYLFIKESVIKYMSKINIYNLIFGENIHEALVHRSYTILSFLYKNKAFKQEQIKHLWNLSQDKYQTISENIIALFGRLLPEFSTNDSNAILKIVSEMNLSEVNEVTLKLLENFFNSNEKNEKLYNILYKLSDELSLNEGLSKNIIIKSRTILVKLLFNQNYTKNLINIIKKCIFNIGKNYLVNTSLSLLKLILEEFDKKEGVPDVKKIFLEINPNIHSMELLIKYLEKKGDLFSVLFVNMLDNAKLIGFLLEETKNLKQIINNKENFDIELSLKLDEMYKKFINPENEYYHNYGLNGNVPQQIINNINPIRQVSSNQLDKTQSTEKSLNEGLIENEDDLEGNNQNIINNIEDIFNNNEEENWDFVINPEKYFKNIFKEYISFIKNIFLKNNNIFTNEEELIEIVYNQFELPFSGNNYYKSINELLEIITSFCVMGKIQIDIGYLNFLYQITIKLGVTNQEKILYYKFLNSILKKQLENRNIILLSDKVLKELILEKNIKYDCVTINQLPYESFEFFKQFFIYFNQKHGNISYTIANKKITSIQRYDLLVGLQILENFYIYAKDNKIYNESFDLLNNIYSICSEELNNRKNILDKIFEFLKNNIDKIKKDGEIKNYFIRELKLISIVNSIKVNNLLDPNDPNNTIELKIKNNYFNRNEDSQPLIVFKGIKIKDLKNEIIQKIILSEENVQLYNQIMTLDNLTLHFSLEDMKQDIYKKGIDVYFRQEILEDNLILNDFQIEPNDCLVVESHSKKDNNNNNKIEFEISEEKLKEGCDQLKNVFNMYEDELLKIALKRNKGDVENTVMYLTDENNINNINKEIEEKKKISQQKNSKKIVKKEEDFIVPLDEDKINLLFDILNEEDNLINDEIWKLLSEIKYPNDVINKATGLELMTVITEPNLYKMLLNLKLVNSLVFDDKFCKFNVIPIEIRSNWLSKFITNESFVTTILNKLNDIGKNVEKNDEKEEKEGEKEENGEKNEVKFEILSIFTNWLHNIFINMINVISNKNMNNIVKDIIKCKEFTLHTNKNINIVNEKENNNNPNNANNGNNIGNNANNANNNNIGHANIINMINNNEAKGFIKILNKNNIVKLLYQLLKTSLNFKKKNTNIIISLLEMFLIYFSINKESIKIFLEEEQKENSIVHLIACDKKRNIRVLAFNFIKILVKNLNNFEKKKKKKIKKDENIIININEINNENEQKELKQKTEDKETKEEKEETKGKVDEDKKNKDKLEKDKDEENKDKEDKKEKDKHLIEKEKIEKETDDGKKKEEKIEKKEKEEKQETEILENKKEKNIETQEKTENKKEEINKEKEDKKEKEKFKQKSEDKIININENKDEIINVNENKDEIININEINENKDEIININEINENKEKEECEEIKIENNNLQEENCAPRIKQKHNIDNTNNGDKNIELKDDNNKIKEENIKKEKEEKNEDEEEEDEIDLEDENDKKLIHNILIILYKEKIISEELYSQEFYMLYGFLLSFKEIKYTEEEKETFIIYTIISYLINSVYNKCKLEQEEFIEKKFNLMYNIYLLCCSHKYYNSLIQYYLQKNESIDLISLLYDGLFKINNTNNIISYKFNWNDIRKHSYNLLSNLISLDSKYLTKILPKMLQHHNKLNKKKQGINVEFKLRDPITDKLIGLRNFGATCYLNSLFQQMFMNPIFSKDLFSFNIEDKSNLENSVIYNMQLGFANLKYSSLNVYPPYNFVKSFKKAFNGEPIQYGVQQDSDEFLTILCDELEKEAKIYGRENFLENSFKGKIANEIVSLDKDHPYYSKTDEDFYRVTLDIKGHKTLDGALDAYVKGEILDGENQYYVEKYQQKLSIRKSSSLKKLGNQIIIHLKRFEFDFVTFTNKKLNDYLSFPKEINFKKWTRAYLRSSDPNLKPDLLNITDEEKENLIEENMNYVLTGILIHSGSSLQSGHYYSLIMDQESGKWYQFNDNVISEFNIEKDLEKECFGNKNSNNNGGEQFGRTAYLLFYTKKSLFRNEKIIKEIKINENILNEVNKENINYLHIKTFTSNLYQDFLTKFANTAFNILQDTNNKDNEKSINKMYRKYIEGYNRYNKLLEINKQKEKSEKEKKNEKKEEIENINELDKIENINEVDKIENINDVEKVENINKANEVENINRINEVENINKVEVEKNNKNEMQKNIEEIMQKINEETPTLKNNKQYNNKDIIKLLVYYTFDIAMNYFDNNVKISSCINILNNHISSNKIFCLSIMKLIEKNIPFFKDILFKCGSKSQDMMSINKEIYDFFKNIFENVYFYEKEHLKILQKKFVYISKDKNTNIYKISQEYESCLFRLVYKLFSQNLELCRKEFANDLMFLHLFHLCTDSFPEISYILEEKLIPLISFITNNSLNHTILKSVENPTFYMGGNPKWKTNENYEKIFSDIIIHSINNGMYNKKKLSPYLIAINPHYNISQNEEILKNFDLFPKLPDNINVMFNEEFLIKYLCSHNCTNELICHLCFEDEDISTNLLIVINDYLRKLNNNINEVENVFNKICSLFTLNDSLTELRLETLFQLNSNAFQGSLFDYFYNVKNSEYVLDFIFNLASAMYQYTSIYQYFLNHKNKIYWIATYIEEIKGDGPLNDNYSRVNSYHPEFMQIIEEGLINRLGFILPDNAPNHNGAQNGDNNLFDDGDDDGFNII